jgi:PRTRC genetic system protein E
MLFQTIAALTSKGVAIDLKITQAGPGLLNVVVIPSTSGDSSPISLVGKSFTATPQDFDSDFVGIIQSMGAINLSLKDQLDAMKKEAEQQQERLKAEAAAKTKVLPKVVAGRKAPTVSDPDEIDDNGQDETPVSPAETGETSTPVETSGFAFSM